MTLKEARSLRPGEIVCHVIRTDVDGGPQKWKVTGKPTMPKNDPKRVKVPIKHGLYADGHLTEANIELFAYADPDSGMGVEHFEVRKVNWCRLLIRLCHYGGEMKRYEEPMDKPYIACAACCHYLQEQTRRKRFVEIEGEIEEGLERWKKEKGGKE